MLSALLIVNAKGDVLISRSYKKDIKRNVSDMFRIHVISNSDIRSPVTTIDKHTFYHVKNENIFLVAVSNANPNACMVFEFLYKIITLGNSYFQVLNEDSVKSNFTLIYELFDEICDFGVPQTTEADTLKLYITTESVQSGKGQSDLDGSKIAIQATGAVSWRRADIKYRKNEAFVDVIESINLIVSAKGTILRSDASGQVIMRSYLSGMPECKFGLNDKVMIETQAGDRPVKTTAQVELDDCQFHQCVKLGKFDAEKVINFIPPDGEFELMKYRTTENISVPFKVRAIVNEVSSNRVEFKVNVRSNYSSKIFAQNIVIKIPTPLNTASTKISVNGGKAKYVGSENCFVWKVAKFQGGEEISFSAVADLTVLNTKKIWSRPPISLDFQVIMFTASGLVVRFLKIFEKSNYQSVKWVRYMTKAGSYQIRF
ncbi:Mu homology domain-containing protein [Globomyces pollinis-pini]|nr:Mu homology domain-containing protein [Globomyces pollinis-pini]